MRSKKFIVRKRRLTRNVRSRSRKKKKVIHRSRNKTNRNVRRRTRRRT